MLEIREYKIAELIEILGTKSRQGIERKLERYGCKFEVSGWGKRVVFNILTTPDEFKVFCITKLNIPAQVNFRKLKMFYYAFFEDEDFIGMPDVDKENYMTDEYEHISRQTIRNWVKYLERENLIMRDTDDCNYYAVNRYPNGDRYLTPISRDTYKKGWSVYWEYAEEYDTFYAYYKATEVWGGAACRTPKIIINGIEWAKIKRLKDIIINSMLNE